MTSPPVMAPRAHACVRGNRFRCHDVSLLVLVLVRFYSPRILGVPFLTSSFPQSIDIPTARSRIAAIFGPCDEITTRSAIWFAILTLAWAVRISPSAIAFANTVPTLIFGPSISAGFTWPYRHRPHDGGSQGGHFGRVSNHVFHTVEAVEPALDPGIGPLAKRLNGPSAMVRAPKRPGWGGVAGALCRPRHNRPAHSLQKNPCQKVGVS